MGAKVVRTRRLRLKQRKGGLSRGFPGLVNRTRRVRTTMLTQASG